MKKVNVVRFALLSAGMVLALGGSDRVNAAASSSLSADASAHILTSITLTKVSDMEFGRVVSSGSTQTATLGTNGSVTCSVPANCASGVTTTAAQFTVGGESGKTYALTGVPSSITIASGGNNMTVDNFSTAQTNSGTLTGGADTIRIGARLNLGASQASGDYTLANGIPITVAYN